MALLYKIWRWVRWPLAVLVVFYIIVVLYRIPAVSEQQRTQETIAKIQSQKITLSDVMGNTLPPVPNKEENDATVEGIDKNNNGIRDDVELAIFSLHASSSKIRAAELQYARERQFELTSIFNQDTWLAVAKIENRGVGCIVDTSASLFSNNSDQIKKLQEWQKEADNLVFNTDMRKQKRDLNQGYESAFATGDEVSCDIDLNTLPN